MKNCNTKTSADVSRDLKKSKLEWNNNKTHQESHTETDSEESETYEIEISWRSTMLISIIHLFALHGLYCFLKLEWAPQTFLIGWIHGQMSCLGTTAGAHRLWAHRSYKAKLPLRILLAYFQTVACQNSIYEWVRDHRVHHKFTETNADPHNAKRGFFFAHVGWLLCKKHEDVKTKGKSVSLADLEADTVVMWQRKHYVPLILVFSFIIPTLISYYFGEETLYLSFIYCLFRYVLSLHFTWLVNSAAHLWGTKPYDRTINPTETTWVSFLTGGEGWHNYHHIFPWDYKASEFGLMKKYNPTTIFINLCAWMGLAYGLKTVPQSIVVSRMKKTGDGSGLPHHH